MGFDEGCITLDSQNHTYYAGQTIFGKLEFQQDKVKTFRGIYVKFKGYAHVHWTTRHSRRVNNKTEHYTVHHNADEEYFSVMEYLVGSANGEHRLKPGNHHFQFQCTIPVSSPSSFEGEYGHVRYEIKIVVDRAFKFDQEKKITFRVIAPLDLNQEPYCRNPLEYQFDDSYCCWCINSGFSETLVKLPVAGYCSGQMIPIEIACTNKSNVEIDKIKMAIMKNVTFYAHNAPGKQHVGELVVEIKKGPIPANTSRNWTIELEVPAMDVVNLDGCRIIDIDYGFKVKVSPSGCHQSSDETKKLVLGTVPLVGFQDNVVNPLQDQMPQIQTIANNMVPLVYPQGFPSPNPPHLGFNQYPGPSVPGPNPPYPNAAPYPPGPGYPGPNPPYPNNSDDPPPYPGLSPYPPANVPYPPTQNVPFPMPQAGGSMPVPFSPAPSAPEPATPDVEKKPDDAPTNFYTTNYPYNPDFMKNQNS